jgi:hypothetical protein
MLTERVHAAMGALRKKSPNFQRATDCERSSVFPASHQRSRGTARLDDDWLARDRLEILAQAYHSGNDAISRSNVHEQHVIGLVMNDSVEQRNELGVTLLAQTALEHRKLQPFSIAIHDPENATPALRIADVIGHDIKVFFLHDITWS